MVSGANIRWTPIPEGLGFESQLDPRFFFRGFISHSLNENIINHFYEYNKISLPVKLHPTLDQSVFDIYVTAQNHTLSSATRGRYYCYFFVTLKRESSLCP